MENIDRLVTTGLFAGLRHPLYLGLICWIFGWVIYNGAAASLIMGFMGIGNIIYWGLLEEDHLLKHIEMNIPHIANEHGFKGTVLEGGWRCLRRG